MEAELLQTGECWVSINYADRGDTTGTLHIDRADPIAWGAPELITRIRAGKGHPDEHLDGDLLTIRGTNRTVIYRVGAYDPQRRAYLMAWPD